MELMADKRETLTKLLLDLIDKKQQRADDLQRMMKEMEAGKEKEQENYWLIQYQKLLDSKPKGLEAAEQKLDTKVCLFFFILYYFLPLSMDGQFICVFYCLFFTQNTKEITFLFLPISRDSTNYFLL